MSQSSDALARAVILAKSQSGAALADVVHRALRDPHVLFVGELLDLPSVGQVRLGCNSRAVRAARRGAAVAGGRSRTAHTVALPMSLFAKQLRGTAFEDVVRMLELFAYGTYSDYKGAGRGHDRQAQVSRVL